MRLLLPLLLISMLAQSCHGETDIGPSDADRQGPAPLAEATQTEADDPLVSGLAALPLHRSGLDAQRSGWAISYFTDTAIVEVWEHYAKVLAERGWHELEDEAWSGDSGRQGTFAKGPAHIHVGVWTGNARDRRNATRVDIRHIGSVAIDRLPRIEAVEASVHCFPQTCIYRSRHPHDGLLQAIIDAMQDEGWTVVPLPPDTQRSGAYANRIVEMRGHGSRLDVSLGPAAAEADEGQAAETPVQYSVRLDEDGGAGD